MIVPLVRRAARSIFRPFGRALRSGAGAGATAMAVVFLAELAAAANLQVMGVRDADLERAILGRVGRHIVAQQIAILGVYLALGCLFGAAVDGMLLVRDAALGRTRSRRRRWIEAAAGALAVGVWRGAVAVVRYPQLFVDLLYAPGGVRRAIAVTLTDHVPRLAVEASGWILLAALVASPLVSARGRAWWRSRIRWRPALALAGALLGVGLVAVPERSRPPPPAADAPPNLLLIAVDSLRADRVGPGHERVAPRLAALAARGVHFQAAYVTIPRTFPSCATLLTGRWPHHHGIRTMFPSAEERRAVGPTLPTALAARGLSTAVVSDFSGEIFSRLPAGFETRKVPHFDLRTIVAQAGLNIHPALLPWAATAVGHRIAPALAAAPENADPDRLADAVIATVREQAQRGPFFTMAFFSAAHFPYAAPDPYYRRFTARDYDGPFRYSKPHAGLGSDAALTPRDVAQVRALYDGAVAAVDDAVGRILDALERDGLAERTIVVLLADHGEDLFEEGRGMGHGEHLHGDQMLHIPLVVYDPVHRFPAHPVPGIVRDVDVAPTLARLVGASLERSDGVDLGPLLRGERPSLGLEAFGETDVWMVASGPGFGPDERLPYPALPDCVTTTADDDIVLQPGLRDLVVAGKHRILRTERWKLYYTPTRAGVRLALHDLAADPAERSDVASQHPVELRALQERLYAWMTEDGSTVEAGFVVPR